MKREITKSRPELRPWPRQRRDLFLGFMFEPQNWRELSNFTQTRSRSHRKDFSSVRDPARSLSRPIHTPPQQPTPLKSQELCVPVEILGPYPHMWSPYTDFGEGGEVTPPPIPSPPHPPHPPPPTSPTVVCLCVVHAQFCRVPKKFPARTSKKFGQFRKKLGKFPKTSISQCLVY